MRPVSVLVVLLAVGCGSPSPIVGTWRYTLPAVVDGGTKDITFDLDIGSSPAADLVVWRLASGCNVALPLTGKIAELAVAPPLCGMSAGALIPLITDTGTVVKKDDQLGVTTARFEVLEDGHLATTLDYKLFTNLQDARVGPVVHVATTAGQHGTRVK